MLGVLASVRASDLTPSIPMTRTREDGVWHKRARGLKAINKLDMRTNDFI